jgi:hypothetical protein
MFQGHISTMWNFDSRMSDLGEIHCGTAKFLEAVTAGRYPAFSGAVGIGHLGHVEIAGRIDAYVVRGHEVARGAAVRAAPAGQPPPRGTEDADSSRSVIGYVAEAGRWIADPPP